MADEPHRTPRWVRAFLLAAVVLALVAVVTALAGVEHGPGLHTPPAGSTPSVPHGT